VAHRRSKYRYNFIIFIVRIYVLHNAVFIIIIGPASGKKKKNPIKSSTNTWRSSSNIIISSKSTSRRTTDLSYGDRGIDDPAQQPPPPPLFSRFTRFQGKSKIGYFATIYTYRVPTNHLYEIVRIEQARRDVIAYIQYALRFEGTEARQIFAQKYNTYLFETIISWS